MIARHTELCEDLLAKMGEVPFLADNLRKLEILPALDRETLRSFFDHGLVLGIFVAGGEYVHDIGLRGQVEAVELVLAIGAANLSSPAAALGSEGEPGCWDVLETVREFFARQPLWANIRSIEAKKWRSLLAMSGLAVIGLEVRIELVRPGGRHHNVFDDAGYPG